MQATIAQVKLLMREIGPAVESIYEVNEIDDGNWIIEFEDATEIQLEWIESNSRLLVSAPIGRTQEGREAEIFPLLLSFNMLTPDTGGARIGLFPEDDSLVLLMDFAADQLTLPTISVELNKFTLLATQLKAVVTSKEDTPPPYDNVLVGQSILV